MQRRSFLAKVAHIAAAVGVSACAATSSFAATGDFPNKPLDIIVTFPPGGGTDMLARLIGNYLTESLGQTAVVENRPGASGNVGARLVADRAPDGYSLLMVNSSFAVNPGVFRNLDFSPTRDFTAVINVAYVPSVIVTAEPAGDAGLPERLRQADTQSRTLAFASCGNGTPQHLAGEMLRQASGAWLQHVPYRGCGPALTDVLSRQVPLGIVTASSAAPFIHAGKLRALAVTSAQRSPLLPDVPTVAEQGAPGYELDQWHGLLAPAGTPPAVIQRLYEALSAIVAEPAMRRELESLGFNPVSEGPERFEALVQADIARFAALTARMGLRAD